MGKFLNGRTRSRGRQQKGRQQKEVGCRTGRQLQRKVAQDGGSSRQKKGDGPQEGSSNGRSYRRRQVKRRVSHKGKADEEGSSRWRQLNQIVTEVALENFTSRRRQIQEKIAQNGGNFRRKQHQTVLALGEVSARRRQLQEKVAPNELSFSRRQLQTLVTLEKGSSGRRQLQKKLAQDEHSFRGRQLQTEVAKGDGS